MKTFGIFEYMKKYQYENIFLCQDDKAAFKAVIAIHRQRKIQRLGVIFRADHDAIRRVQGAQQ